MAEGVLSAAELQTLVDRRLDEIDRALLGLLPRAERLEIVASVEARVQALGDVSLPREAAAETLNPAPAAVRTRSRGQRSRLAFSSGVLGIVAVSCLIASPLLLIGLSIFGELLGETFSIMLFGLLTALVALGGGLAVFCGGVSLFRLARREQSATGTGWAITGLCTGALPMLIGFVGVVSLVATVMPSETVQVTWNATPAGGGPYYAAPQPIGYPMPPGMIAPPHGFVAPPPAPQTGWSCQPLPAAPSAIPAAQLAAQPKPEPAPKLEAQEESQPEPKPELNERPALPLDESAEVED